MRLAPLVLLLVCWVRSAHAVCPHDCPVDQRDEHGCCPARADKPRPKPKPAPAPVIRIGKLATQCRDAGGCGFACSKGDGAACLRAGDLAWFGLGGDSRGDAIAFYRRACDAKVTAGCASWGEALGRGLGDSPDPKKAESLLAPACKAGDGRGCMGLAGLQLSGKATAGKGEPKALLDKAHALLDRACNRNEDMACLQLAELHGMRSGLLPDGKLVKAALAHALAYATARCSGGYDDGCVIKWRLQAGLDGMEVEPAAAAVTELAALCDKGYGAACGGAVSVIMAGRMDAAVVSLVVPLAQKGCGMDDPASCYHLAMHELSKPADAEEREHKLAAACEQGLGMACTALSAEKKTAGDYQGQKRWLDRACQVDPGICRGGMQASHPPRVELQAVGCTIPPLGRAYVVGGAQLSITSGGGVVVGVTVGLTQVEPEMKVSTQAWVDNRVHLMIITPTGTYMSMATSEPDQVKGTLAVSRYEPDTGYMEVTFKDVTLQSSAGGQLCVLNGKVITNGRDY